MRAVDCLYAALDLETTGFSFEDRVCEVGLAHFGLDGREKIACASFLVNPQRPIPEDALRVHGITQEMVQHLPPLEVVKPALEEMLDGRVVVIHSAEFERRFVGEILERKNVVDTCKLAKRVLPGLQSYSLRSLAPEPRPWHRAGPDAQAAAILLARCVERLRDMYTREPTLEDLL